MVKRRAPQRRLIRVVYGPPGSGKSTFIEQRRAPNEPVIDLDKIAEAIGSPNTHAHNPTIYEVSQAARSGAIRRILDHRIPAWIIDTKLSTEILRNRAFLCDFILIDPGIEETRRRATASGRPERVFKDIDDWYANPPEVPAQTQFGTGGKRSDTVRKHARAAIAKTRASCHICGKAIDYTLKWPDPMCFVADHIIPLDKGGADDPTNMAASHAKCNSTKRARLVAPIIRRSGALD